MNRAQVAEVVNEVVRRVASLQGLTLPELDEELEIVDGLGFNSMAVASLIAIVEDELGTDPFRGQSVLISDMRTLGDLQRAYAGDVLEFAGSAA